MTSNVFKDDRGSPPGAEIEALPNQGAGLKGPFFIREGHDPQQAEEIDHILTPGQRLAMLAQPVLPGRQIKELSRNNFFNVGHSGNHIRIVTPPPELFRHFLVSMHEPIDPAMDGLIGYLFAKYTILLSRDLPLDTHSIKQREVEEMIADHIPQNSAINQGFDTLNLYLEELHGPEFEIPMAQGAWFGKFAVAQAVMYENL